MAGRVISAPNTIGTLGIDDLLDSRTVHLHSSGRCVAEWAGWLDTMAYLLVGADGLPYVSERPGALGGHRGTRIYGRLDCRSARQAIARGGYVTQRVFFADEQTAIAAGYRPCAVCLPQAYAEWRASSVRDA
jgi:hypothetical protein